MTIAKGECQRHKDDATLAKADANKALKRAADLEAKLKSLTVSSCRSRHLRRLIAVQKQGSNALVSELEDSLCCEICTLKMWTPYKYVFRSIFVRNDADQSYQSPLRPHVLPNLPQRLVYGDSHAIHGRKSTLQPPRPAAFSDTCASSGAPGCSTPLGQLSPSRSPAAQAPRCEHSEPDHPIRAILAPTRPLYGRHQ